MAHPRLIAIAGALLLLALAACQSRSSAALQTGSEPWSAPALEQVVRVFDGRTGQEISFAEMMDDLADADVVFLGETHLDETTHRVEHAVYRDLIDREGGRVVLAMEMFEQNVQPTLDAYVAGEIDEAEFLANARPWNNYHTGYRPMVETARAEGLPVVASNFPRPLRMRMAREGTEVLEQLSEEERRWVPDTFHENSAAYWERVDNATRGHGAMMGGGGDESRLYSTQSLWDNSMGFSCAEALDQHPGSMVLHVNGGFHSAHWDGTVHQLRVRKPDARIQTVAIEPVDRPDTAAAPDGEPVADYVVYAAALASGPNRGDQTVTVSMPLRYVMHLPESATHENPVPLLIWLGNDGTVPTDGVALWKERLGDEVALCVIQAPHRETLEDLSRGDRWFFGDQLAEDLRLAQTGIDRIWAYLMRYYPLRPDAVCVAGEGTGGTVVASFALRDRRLGDVGASAVAIAPTGYQRLGEFALPLTGGATAPPLRILLPADGDTSFWDDELVGWRALGLDARVEAFGNDPWRAEREIEDALRTALDLPTTTGGAATRLAHVRAPADSPRARHWARLLALSHALESGDSVALLGERDAASRGSREVPVAIRPDDFRAKGALPKAPGAFGGTTVVVVEGADAATTQGWIALEEDEVLSTESRFHRLRVSTGQGGARPLGDVLDTLASEGRNNVLIVPALFWADGDTMRALRRAVVEQEESMTLHWSPGLGGRLPRAKGASPSS